MSASAAVEPIMQNNLCEAALWGHPCRLQKLLKNTDKGRQNRLTGTKNALSCLGDTVGRTGDASPVSPAVATPVPPGKLGYSYRPAPWRDNVQHICITPAVQCIQPNAPICRDLTQNFKLFRGDTPDSHIGEGLGRSSLPRLPRLPT